jgi:hypothetical protein
MSKVRLILAKENRKKAAVISHERSGTHFLMNTLALNFGYISKHWWNFDFEHGLNFHAPHGLLKYFKQVHDKPVLNILKSHHPINFFIDFIEYFQEQFYLFYILRDPRDVLTSRWKRINEVAWDEGPKTSTVSDFIRSEPRGAMMRYQKNQEKNLITRWKNHVEGWLDYSETKKGKDIIIIKYEDLNLNFTETVKNIGEKTGLTPITNINRPDKNVNVIGKGPGKVNTYNQFFTSDDNEFVLKNAGDLMKRLGYI